MPLRPRAGWAAGFDDIDPHVVQAADDYARGRPVQAPPPSLRIYALAKDSPSLVTLNALAEDWELWRELEAYAAATHAEQARRHKEAEQKRRQKARRR